MVLTLRLAMSDISLAPLASPDVLCRARKIKLFLMDVDGTLTDGGVILIPTTAADGANAGSVSEMKIFDAKTGKVFRLLILWASRPVPLRVAARPLTKRAEELKVTFVYLGQAKMEAFEECVRKAGVTEDEVAYLGDDLPDIPLAERWPRCFSSGWRR